MRSSSDLRTQYSIMSSSSSSIGLGVEFIINNLLPSSSDENDFDRKVPIDFFCFCCCSFLKEEKPPPRATHLLLDKLLLLRPPDVNEEERRILLVVVGIVLIIIIIIFNKNKVINDTKKSAF